MDSSRSVVVSRPPSPSLTAALARCDAENIPVHVVGWSNHDIYPQRVGDWWMEPLRTTDGLPSRAQARLLDAIGAGLRPKAIVLFHEPRHPGASTEPVARLIGPSTRWLHQELPEHARRVGEVARRHAPAIGRHLLLGTVAAAAVAGTLGLMALSATAAVVGAVAVDPVLVLVTEDGYWIEIDRWVE